jgi:hypothetical protein
MAKHVTPPLFIPWHGQGCGDDNALHCPNCKYSYLHHDVVTVYSRQGGREDAEQTITTEVSDGGTTRHTMDPSGCSNPSSRRDGLAIRFWCECCDYKPELTIEQHKGYTYLGWRPAFIRDE